MDIAFLPFNALVPAFLNFVYTLGETCPSAMWLLAHIVYNKSKTSQGIFKWTKHPAYSSDLATLNYYLFYDQHMQEVVHMYIRRVPLNARNAHSLLSNVKQG